MNAIFNSGYNAALYEAAGRDPHILRAAILYLRANYRNVVLKPEHIRWASTKVTRVETEASGD